MIHTGDTTETLHIAVISLEGKLIVSGCTRTLSQITQKKYRYNDMDKSSNNITKDTPNIALQSVCIPTIHCSLTSTTD